MEDTKKIEMTKACRVKGIGHKIGDVITVRAEDYYYLCGIGKGKVPAKKESKKESK